MNAKPKGALLPVYVLDGSDSLPRKEPSLTCAMLAPPMTPESIIFCRGEMLAESDEEDARWVVTKAGMQRIADEDNAKDMFDLLSGVGIR